MSKIYDEPQYNASFDRCIDVMAKLIQKYGKQVLDRQKEDVSFSLCDHSKNYSLDNAV